METLEDKKTITENIEFLKWYLDKTDDNYEISKDEDENEKLFFFLSTCVYEDPFVFFRIVLYIANTRNTPSQELIYRQILHFLSTLTPQYILANLDLLIEFGYKNDILFLLSSSNIQKRVIKYINHVAKNDNDFKLLLDGKLIDKERKKLISYNILEDPIKLLETILDDNTFNGISMPKQGEY